MNARFSILTMLFEQNYDPAAFLHRLQATPWKNMGAVWLERVILIGIWGAVLSAIVLTGGQKEALTFSLLLLAFLLTMVAIFTLFTRSPHFWFLYLCSPAMLLISATGNVIWLWEGACNDILIAFTYAFAIGLMAADGFPVWAYRREQQLLKEKVCPRIGGPDAELIGLKLRNQTRFLRIAGLGLFILLALYLREPGRLFVGYFLGIAAGYLRLGAILTALLLPLPLVARDESGGWRATYLGRTALWAPQKRFQALFTPAIPPADQALALRALLAQGFLGPAARTACRTLPFPTLQPLLLALSFQAGGAAGLRYLAPGLSPAGAAAANLYATLAEEAARPFDLQGWERLLDTAISTAASAGEPLLPTLTILQEVRKAMDAPTRNGEIEMALEGLQRLRRNGDMERPRPEGAVAISAPWPVMLAWHLERHRERLETAGGR